MALSELTEQSSTELKPGSTITQSFEDQPPFAGFREQATNGVDKTVLNAFRMLGLLGNERLNVTSSAALSSDEIVRSGVRGSPDINAIAARKEREVEVLVWNYHDDDVAFPAGRELPGRVGRAPHY